MTRIEHIGLSLQVALDSSCPQAVARLGHLHLLLTYLDSTLGIVGRKELEDGLLWRVAHLVELKVLCLYAC